MRNLSNAQAKALERGSAFVQDTLAIVDEGVATHDEIYEKCLEFAANARDGKAATSALAAYIDSSCIKLDNMLACCANAVHEITHAPYGSIHVTFDDMDYTEKIASLLCLVIEAEMLAGEVIECARAKYEEAVNR